MHRRGPEGAHPPRLCSANERWTRPGRRGRRPQGTRANPASRKFRSKVKASSIPRSFITAKLVQSVKLHRLSGRPSKRRSAASNVPGSIQATTTFFEDKTVLARRAAVGASDAIRRKVTTSSRTKLDVTREPWTPRASSPLAERAAELFLSFGRDRAIQAPESTKIIRP